MKINKLLAKIAPATLCLVMLTGCADQVNTSQTENQTTVISNETITNTSVNNMEASSDAKVSTVATQVTLGSMVDVSYESDDYVVDWRNQDYETITLNGSNRNTY